MEEQFISKTRLLKAIEKSRFDNPHNDPKVRANHDYEHDHFSYMVLNTPNADVRPVVHARWIENEDSYAEPPKEQNMTCSNCGQRSNRPVGNFCRWCGADMREVTPDDQR